MTCITWWKLCQNHTLKNGSKRKNDVMLTLVHVATKYIVSSKWNQVHMLILEEKSHCPQKWWLSYQIKHGSYLRILSTMQIMVKYCPTLGSTSKVHFICILVKDQHAICCTISSCIWFNKCDDMYSSVFTSAFKQGWPKDKDLQLIISDMRYITFF